MALRVFRVVKSAKLVLGSKQGPCAIEKAMITICFFIVFFQLLFRDKKGFEHIPLPRCGFLSQLSIRALNVFQELPVHKEDTVNSHVFCLHQSCCELEERPRQVDQIINLPPFSVSEFEL